MIFNAIRVHSAPEVLVEQIIKSIKTGDLQPGNRLPSQRELAAMFRVGLGTVREAVKILHAMGYMEVIQGKGTFIAHNALDKEKSGSVFEKAMEAVSLDDLMKAREIVECEAAKLAAEKADDDNIKSLQEILEQMKAEQGNWKRFNKADFDFHVAVAEATNNRAVHEITRLLVDRAYDYIGFMEESLKTFELFNIEKAIDSAQRTLDHIIAGDGEEASRAMYDHLNIVNFELAKGFIKK